MWLTGRIDATELWYWVANPEQARWGDVRLCLATADHTSVDIAPAPNARKLVEQYRRGELS